MTILDVFDPKKDGWFFENWGDTVPFTWDLYRKTYLAINPTNDPVEAPLDVAYYEIFKNCSTGGNCGGLCMLALAIFKYGGYMGYCSPPNFFTGPPGPSGPSRADLKSAINIMQARQFSAAGIRNFVDVVKTGDLNNALTVYTRVQDGLASGDYCMISLADSLLGGNAHTIIPYRAEMIGGMRTIHVWDPNRPYNRFPRYYDEDHNKIVISGPTGWSYDQNGGSLGLTGGHLYAGSQNGWFFAIPTSLEIHKGRHPFSLGFAFTQLMTIFVSGNGAAVTQIEDADGRRLYTADRARPAALEADPDRRMRGVAPWPWVGGVSNDRPGDLFFIERPAGSAPLTLSVRGQDYRLMHLSSGHLTEVVASPTTSVKDRIRIGGSPDDDQTVEVSTGARRRQFDIHHLRQGTEGWRSVRVSNAVVTNDRLRVDVPVSFDAVELSGTTSRRSVDVELRRGSDGKVIRRKVSGQSVPAGRAVRLGPSDWDRLSRGKVEQAVS
jgi:hypothetical protein